MVSNPPNQFLNISYFYFFRNFNPLERKIITTNDGSHSIAVPEMNVTYHSIHGAIQESLHVYINAGFFPLLHQSKQTVHILEMGFGTGLNALLTMMEAEKNQRPVFYQAIDFFPLEKEQANLLNYCSLLNRKDLQQYFEKLHACEWEKDIVVTQLFTIHKTNCDLIDFSTDQRFHLIYFDAFAPAAQPMLWTKAIFENLYSLLEPGGILVTYCSKGDVRRALLSAGFHVDKIAGPKGKREMIRAEKLVDG